MQEKLTIYYDSDCGFCKKACLFLISFFRLSHARIAEVLSDKQTQDIFITEYSWSVHCSANQKYYTKSSAFWHLVKASPSTFSFISRISSFPGVLWLGDMVYDFVARVRPKTCTVK